jgi:hypothetical protein
MHHFEKWLNVTPIPMIALFLMAAMLFVAYLGLLMRRRKERRADPDKPDDESHDGFVISSVLGLLALLLGFTFSLAVDRYDARRVLVLDEANAIGTAYLRAQLLEEPHRSRMSQILHDYTENRVALGEASVWENRKPLFEKSDSLITDLWSATAASFDTVRNLDFSTSLLEPVNAVIDFDSSRKTARTARVPVAVFAVLFLYVLATAGMLGFMVHCARNIAQTVVFLALLSLSLLLIVDIDGPTTGWVKEPQLPMIMLQKSLRQTPPGTYDRWREGAPPPTPAPMGQETER